MTHRLHRVDSPALPWSCASLVATIACCSLVFAQSLQDSWPHEYPGMPTGDYSPEWQSYFQVTENLPNVSWPLARNWAGNIPVQRQGHPNNTLFFWAFESSDGSFTANSSEPWVIWLNGGPGGSSLFGLLIENGPIHIGGDYSAFENKYSWSTIADHVWIDQPVGTGFSTVDPNGYGEYALIFILILLGQLCIAYTLLIHSQMGFLENFVKVFPNLATRPLYLMGESYAGVYIPYIAKTYFEASHPPVNLSAISIGDGAIGSIQAFSYVPIVTVLETYPQIIGYDIEVLEYFREQSSLCGFNLALQYPQPGHFPTINAPVPFDGTSFNYKSNTLKRQTQDRFAERLKSGDSSGSPRRLRARDAWKRNLAGRANGTIDPWYQCDLFDEMIAYAVNYTFPWSSGGLFNQYDVPDALSPEVSTDPSVFLNDPQTRTAIHAPTSKDWALVTSPVFAPTNSSTNIFSDPNLATNMTAHRMKVVIYSGNDDSLVPHYCSQIVIQNTTFCGIQGFTRKPETPWYNDNGELGGIVHQERGWTYVLVKNAGHMIAYNNPISALTLFREFIIGNNRTGLVTETESGEVGVVGGEVSSLGNVIMPGQTAIYYGQATTASSYFFPSATVDAWNAYMATAKVP